MKSYKSKIALYANTRIPDNLYSQVLEYAKRREWSIAHVLRKSLEHYITTVINKDKKAAA